MSAQTLKPNSFFGSKPSKTRQMEKSNLIGFWAASQSPTPAIFCVAMGFPEGEGVVAWVLRKHEVSKGVAVPELSPHTGDAVAEGVRAPCSL